MQDFVRFLHSSRILTDGNILFFAIALSVFLGWYFWVCVRDNIQLMCIPFLNSKNNKITTRISLCISLAGAILCSTVIIFSILLLVAGYDLVLEEDTYTVGQFEQIELDMEDDTAPLVLLTLLGNDETETKVVFNIPYAYNDLNIRGIDKFEKNADNDELLIRHFWYQEDEIILRSNKTGKLNDFLVEQEQKAKTRFFGIT